jgi:hypothetical protein
MTAFDFFKHTITGHHKCCSHSRDTFWIYWGLGRNTGNHQTITIHESDPMGIREFIR